MKEQDAKQIGNAKRCNNMLNLVTHHIDRRLDRCDERRVI